MSVEYTPPPAGPGRTIPAGGVDGQIVAADDSAEDGVSWSDVAIAATIYAAKGTIAAGTNTPNTPTGVVAGANDTILMADSAQTGGVKWTTRANVLNALAEIDDATAALANLGVDTAVSAITGNILGGSGRRYFASGAITVTTPHSTANNLITAIPGRGFEVIAAAATVAVVPYTGDTVMGGASVTVAPNTAKSFDSIPGGTDWRQV